MAMMTQTGFFRGNAGVLVGLVAVLAGCGGRTGPLRGTPGGADTDAGGAVPDGAFDAILPDAGPRVPGTWVTVKSGTFTMGSPSTEPCRNDNETQHEVTLTHWLEVSTTEVTAAQFKAVVGDVPARSQGCDGTCPVASVTWSAAAVYCNYISKIKGLDRCYSCDAKDGQYAYPYNCRVRAPWDGSGTQRLQHCPGYRLPTEAEWEYLYRAATSTALYTGAMPACYADTAASKVAWYAENAMGRPHTAGTKKPNAWGLYDMAGNVWEWTSDWYTPNLGTSAVKDPVGPSTGSGRVIRGGAWSVSASGVRAAVRNQLSPATASPIVGFRCVRTLVPHN